MQPLFSVYKLPFICVFFSHSFTHLGVWHFFSLNKYRNMKNIEFPTQEWHFIRVYLILTAGVNTVLCFCLLAGLDVSVCRWGEIRDRERLSTWTWRTDCLVSVSHHMCSSNSSYQWNNLCKKKKKALLQLCQTASNYLLTATHHRHNESSPSRSRSSSLSSSACVTLGSTAPLKPPHPCLCFADSPRGKDR